MLVNCVSIKELCADWRFCVSHHVVVRKSAISVWHIPFHSESHLLLSGLEVVAGYLKSKYSGFILTGTLPLKCPKHLSAYFLHSVPILISSFFLNLTLLSKCYLLSGIWQVLSWWLSPSAVFQWMELSVPHFSYLTKERQNVPSRVLFWRRNSDRRINSVVEHRS